MDEREAKRNDRRRRVLLLAAIDMEQAAYAARGIQCEHARDGPVQLVRALETAVAVCYARPFTDSRIGKLDGVQDGPAPGPASDLHQALLMLRDTRFAHTDRVSGRTADVLAHKTDQGESAYTFTETWQPLPAEWLPAIIELAESRRDAFREEGTGLTEKLRGAGYQV